MKLNIKMETEFRLKRSSSIYKQCPQQSLKPYDIFEEGTEGSKCDCKIKMQRKGWKIIFFFSCYAFISSLSSGIKKKKKKYRGSVKTSKICLTGVLEIENRKYR